MRCGRRGKGEGEGMEELWRAVGEVDVEAGEGGEQEEEVKEAE